MGLAVWQISHLQKLKKAKSGGRRPRNAAKRKACLLRRQARAAAVPRSRTTSCRTGGEQSGDKEKNPGVAGTAMGAPPPLETEQLEPRQQRQQPQTLNP